MKARDIIEDETPKGIFRRLRQASGIPPDTRVYYVQLAPADVPWSNAEMAPINVYDDGQAELTDGFYELTGAAGRAGADGAKVYRDYVFRIELGIRQGHTYGELQGVLGAYKWRLLRREENGWYYPVAGSTGRAAQESEDPRSVFKAFRRPKGVSINDIDVHENRSVPAHETGRWVAEWKTPFLLAHRYIRGCPVGEGNSLYSSIRDLVDSTNKESGTKFWFTFSGGFTAPAQQSEAEDPAQFLKHTMARRHPHTVVAQTCEWIVDGDGNVLEFEVRDGEPSTLDDLAELQRFAKVKRFDFDEYQRYWGDIPDGIDISDIGFWLKDGSYEAADEQYRQDIKSGGIAR